MPTGRGREMRGVPDLSLDTGAYTIAPSEDKREWIERTREALAGERDTDELHDYDVRRDGGGTVVGIHEVKVRLGDEDDPFTCIEWHHEFRAPDGDVLMTLDDGTLAGADGSVLATVERSLLLFGGYRVVGPDGSKLASVSSDGSLLELFSLSTHWSYAVEGTDGQRLASIGYVRAEGDPAEQALSEVAVAIETGTVPPGGAAGCRLRNPGSARAVRKVAEPGSARRMPTFGFEQVGYSR